MLSEWSKGRVGGGKDRTVLGLVRQGASCTIALSEVEAMESLRGGIDLG